MPIARGMRRIRDRRSLRTAVWTLLLGAGFLVVAAPVVGNPPDAVDDTATTSAGSPVVIDVLANDSPGYAGPLDPSSVSVTSGPAHGGTSVNATTGAVTYTPAAGFSGPDSFDYQVCEALETGSVGAQACASATVSVAVNGAAAPAPPVPPSAGNDFAQTPMGTPIALNVLGNDSDSDGTLQPGSVHVVSPPAHGTTSVDPSTGVITYTPSFLFVGIDTFTYQVCDDQSECTSATASVEVAATATDDTGNGGGGTAAAPAPSNPTGASAGSNAGTDPGRSDPLPTTGSTTGPLALVGLLLVAAGLACRRAAAALSPTR